MGLGLGLGLGFGLPLPRTSSTRKRSAAIWPSEAARWTGVRLFWSRRSGLFPRESTCEISAR